MTPERLVFLAETGASAAMARRYARVVGAVPHGHRQTTTGRAALRHDGRRAPCVCDGASNGPRFLAHLAQVLAPPLRAGDVVVPDDLPAHKGKGVREALAATGAALLPLPPDSPHLNPREHAFAQLKALLRTAAARPIDVLWRTSGQLRDAFSPTPCAHHLAHPACSTSSGNALAYDGDSSSVRPLAFAAAIKNMKALLQNA